jgi:Cytochrome oxidase complex assembly protein 1
VQQLLGEPISVGIILGNIHINGSVGHADLTIPISSPNGKGVIHAVANERADVWRFVFLRVSIEGQGEPIDLLSGQLPSGREF